MRNKQPPRLTSIPLSDDDSDGASQSGTDPGASLVSDSEEGNDGLIAKPTGEAGRPSRGGYTFQLALSWDTVAYNKLKV